jgi:hypothetical protein
MHYVMHQSVHIDQDFQGVHQPLAFGLSAFFRVTITGPADTAGYPTRISIDSIVPDSGTTVPMAINLGAAKGLAFTGHLTPQRDFVNQTASDSTAAQALSPIVGSFRSFFPRLPASGVSLGATWTDTLNLNDRAAGNVAVKSISHSRATAWEDHGGAHCLRLEVAATFTVEGSGQQMNQPFQVAGTGIRSGVDYVAADGRYMGGEASDSTSMTITLPVQQMTIPRTQVSRTTITVLP